GHPNSDPPFAVASLQHGLSPAPAPTTNLSRIIWPDGFELPLAKKINLAYHLVVCDDQLAVGRFQKRVDLQRGETVFGGIAGETVRRPFLQATRSSNPQVAVAVFNYIKNPTIAKPLHSGERFKGEFTSRITSRCTIQSIGADPQTAIRGLKHREYPR